MAEMSLRERICNTLCCAPVTFTFFIGSPCICYLHSRSVAQQREPGCAPCIEQREFIAGTGIRRTPGNHLRTQDCPQILWISLCISSPQTRKPTIRKRFSYPPKE